MNYYPYLCYSLINLILIWFEPLIHQMIYLIMHPTTPM